MTYKVFINPFQFNYGKSSPKNSYRTVKHKKLSDMSIVKYLSILFLLTCWTSMNGQTTLPVSEPTSTNKSTNIAPSKKSDANSASKANTNLPKEKAQSQLLLTFDTDGELEIDGVSKGAFGSGDVWKENLSPGIFLIKYSKGAISYKEVVTLEEGAKKFMDIQLLPIIAAEDPDYLVMEKARNGDKSAMYKLGTTALASGERDVAYEWFEKACNSGYHEACKKAITLTSDMRSLCKLYQQWAESGDAICLAKSIRMKYGVYEVEGNCFDWLVVKSETVDQMILSASKSGNYTDNEKSYIFSTIAWLYHAGILKNSGRRSLKKEYFEKSLSYGGDGLGLYLAGDWYDGYSPATSIYGETPKKMFKTTEEVEGFKERNEEFIRRHELALEYFEKARGEGIPDLERRVNQVKAQLKGAYVYQKDGYR